MVLAGCGKRVPDPRKRHSGERRINNLRRLAGVEKGFFRILLEDGVVRFYDDIYGHDAALQRILASGYPYAR